MPPKKNGSTATFVWVASSPAPAKVNLKVPHVKELNKFTSSPGQLKEDPKGL
jgi:hypothetical protein